MTSAEAWFNNSLRPRKPEGSLGRTAQDGHLDSHTAPELWEPNQGNAENFTSDDKPRFPTPLLQTPAIFGSAVELSATIAPKHDAVSALREMCQKFDY